LYLYFKKIINNEKILKKHWKKVEYAILKKYLRELKKLFDFFKCYNLKFIQRDTTSKINYSNLLRTLKTEQLNRSELRQMLAQENRVTSTQEGNYLFVLIIYGQVLTLKHSSLHLPYLAYEK